MANKPKSLAPKKQLKKADKVVRKVAGKTTKPKKTKPKVVKELIVDLNAARRILAHATCHANDLTKTDTFTVPTWYDVLLPGVDAYVQENWLAYQNEEVEFKGIDLNGNIVISPLNDPEDDYCIPLEAVDFTTVDSSLRHSERRVELTDEYDAVITTRDPNSVIVGCQVIPVRAIREVLTEVDELNALVAERQAMLDKNKPIAGVYPYLKYED